MFPGYPASIYYPSPLCDLPFILNLWFICNSTPKNRKTPLSLQPLDHTEIFQWFLCNVLMLLFLESHCMLWRTYNSISNLIHLVELVASYQQVDIKRRTSICWFYNSNLPINISLSCHRRLLCMLADGGTQGDKLLTQGFSLIDSSGNHRGHWGLFDVTSFSPGWVKIELSGWCDAITTHSWKLLGFWIEIAAKQMDGGMCFSG